LQGLGFTGDFPVGGRRLEIVGRGGRDLR